MFRTSKNFSNDMYSAILDAGGARLTYNQMRSKSKLGMLPAFFVLFKSCVGLGLFSYPFAFGKVIRPDKGRDLLRNHPHRDALLSLHLRYVRHRQLCG